MKWFGRKGGRTVAHPFLLSGWTGVSGQADWPRSYDAQLREAFLQNPVAQRSVRLVTEGVGGASLYAGEGHEQVVGLLSHAVRETVAVTGITVTHLLTGEALRPPSPVHLKARRDGNGGIAISWVRRSRSGWDWLDGNETPLGEEVERYQLRLTGSGTPRTLAITGPGYFYSAAEQAGDGGGPLTIEVSQIGTIATSRATTLIVERP